MYELVYKYLQVDPDTRDLPPRAAVSREKQVTRECEYLQVLPRFNL